MTKRSRRPRPQPKLLDAAPPFLTREQAAAIAGVSMRTIDRWRTEGVLTDLRHSQVRGRSRIVIKRDELRALLAPR